jgi:hypothetical protein
MASPTGSDFWCYIRIGASIAAAAFAAVAVAPPAVAGKDGTAASGLGVSLGNVEPRLRIPTTSGRAHATVAATAGCSGDYHRIVPVAAKTQGVGTSVWRFRLGLFADKAASVDIAALVKNQANPNPAVVNVQVPAGEEVVLDNVLGTLFNTANAGLGLRYCSGFPLAEGYFYNQGGTPGVVYGATVPAHDERQATRSFRPAIFHNLSYTPSAVQDRRVNIGATSNSDHNVDMRIDLYDGATLLGTINHTLLPFEHRQFTNVHQMVGAPAVASGHAVVRMLTDPAEVYTYALQVENKSGDLVYQPANLAPPPFGPLVPIFEGTWTGTWNNDTFASSGSVTWTIDILDDAGAAAVVEPPPPIVALATGGPPGLLGAASATEAMLGDWTPAAAACFVTLLMNYNGSVFGGADPAAQLLYGYKVLGGLLFYGTVPVFGHYNLFVNEKGRISGVFTKIPNPSIAFVSLWGALAYSQIALDMKIGFGGTSYAMARNLLYRQEL